MPEITGHDGELSQLLSGFPSTKAICDAVGQLRPEHTRFLLKGMRSRSPELLKTTERLAMAVLNLCSPDLKSVAQNYLWTCDRLNEEELYFHRHGAYRLKTFDEAFAEVYSDGEYMEKYMSGLLLTQVLWFNHAASFDFYQHVTRELLPPGSKYLEVGPGHGLMLYLSMTDLSLQSALAWDISDVSIAQTQTALRRLGVDGCTFAVQDVVSGALTEIRDTFDIIVLSEILEHLERPAEVLEKIGRLLSRNGYIFVNIPINSPSPDHLYLLSTEAEAISLLQDAGLEVVRSSFFATQGMDLAKAIRNRVSVSACMFAQLRRGD